MNSRDYNITLGICAFIKAELGQVDLDTPHEIKDKKVARVFEGLNYTVEGPAGLVYDCSHVESDGFNDPNYGTDIYSRVVNVQYMQSWGWTRFTIRQRKPDNYLWIDVQVFGKFADKQTEKAYFKELV
jgi:hypothetical protein